MGISRRITMIIEGGGGKEEGGGMYARDEEEGGGVGMRRNEEEGAQIQSYSKLTLTHSYSLALGFTRLHRTCRPRGRALMARHS